MQIKILLLFLVVSTNILGAQTVYILVHGTWAHDTSWHMPGGDFFERFKETIPSGSSIVSFTWSGKNDHRKRIEGAERLVGLLQSYPKETTIYLICHSHGSNVGIIASQMLGQQDNTHTKIQTFFALGTPVGQTYKPDMNVIKFFYNLVSYEDMVQPVLGFFGREFPDHERIANIRVFLNGKEPGHSDLHHPLIAQWLLCLENIFVLDTEPSHIFQIPSNLYLTPDTIRYELDEHRISKQEDDIALQQMLLDTFARKKCIRTLNV